jgi:acylphosphatase
VKLTLKISGPKVHDVGYRAFLLDSAEDLGLQGFHARNTVEEGMQVVVAYLDGDEKNLAEFRKNIEAERPAKAEVSALTFE